MAFDYHCDEVLDPESLLKAWEPVWSDEVGLEAGVAGHGDPKSYTRYIGGMTSGRRLRIYRKDLERGGGDALLRVELVLKGELAHSILWEMLCVKAGSCDQWRRDLAAVEHAAGHVVEMTGFFPVPEWENVPMRVAKPRVKIAATIAAMATQYVKALAICEAMDIDLQPLVEARKVQLSRASKHRHKKALEEAEESSAAEIQAQALDLVLNGFGGGS